MWRLEACYAERNRVTAQENAAASLNPQGRPQGAASFDQSIDNVNMSVGSCQLQSCPPLVTLCTLHLTPSI